MTDKDTDAQTFKYFDGREWCPEVYEWELHAVTIETDTVEFHRHSGGVDRANTTVAVDPPTRAMYPRPVETVGEVYALWMGDEITIGEFERYLEGVIGDD